MTQDQFPDSLTRYRKENGLSVDDLLDAARQSDPDGYSREALRAMYKGARRFTYRGMVAMAKGAGVDPSSFPEIRLAYAQYLIDDRIHGLDQALVNLDLIDPEGKLNPDLDGRTLPPIKGRNEAIEDATLKARQVERRLNVRNPKRAN